MKLKILKPLFHDYLTLKKLRRTGWQMRGIRDCESLADHCFGVVFLTMVIGDMLAQPDMDRGKALRMAMVHELGECRVGDIPFPALEFLKGKSEAELGAVNAVLSPLGKNRSELMDLYKEYENGISTEAKFVKAVDKLEMLITAHEYERTGFLALGDFWENPSTFKAFEPFPELAELAQDLKKNRPGKNQGKGELETIGEMEKI